MHLLHFDREKSNALISRMQVAHPARCHRRRVPFPPVVQKPRRFSWLPALRGAALAAASRWRKCLANVVQRERAGVAEMCQQFVLVLNQRYNEQRAAVLGYYPAAASPLPPAHGSFPLATACTAFP
jgi:hypothetical protein